jgi:hypothetical protein
LLDEARRALRDQAGLTHLQDGADTVSGRWSSIQHPLFAALSSSLGPVRKTRSTVAKGRWSAILNPGTIARTLLFLPTLAYSRKQRTKA